LELIWIRVRHVGGQKSTPHVPAFDQRSPGADVSQGNREQGNAALLCDECGAPRKLEGAATASGGEIDPLGAIFGARRHEGGPHSDQHRALGDPSRSIGRARGAEGGDREDQRPAGGPKLGDRRDVGQGG
jgi:hypothetical protein